MTSGTGSGSSSAGNGGGKFVPPSTADLDAILDAYEFIDILGQGGMGAVYRARQKSLDREVAIKILPPDLGDNSEDGESFRFAERFQREARAMAKLSHPNIISVYDFGQASDGQLYIVMEFIEGSDLHGLIRGGEMTTDHVLGWTSQICDALQYAHSRGIIHRDIKPANVMISHEGQVKIADFGLAKLTGAGEVEGGLTMTNMAMGTPDYIAPEALEDGIDVDHRADLYAVGVMLYEMLTGKVPRGSWKSPSSQVANLDARYDALVERAMDGDRDGRFQNATDIASTLYEISTTSAAPLTAGGKSLITGDAAAAAASGGNVVSGTVKKDLSALSSNQDETEGDIPVATALPKKRTGLIVGIVAAVLAVSALAFFLLRPDPTDKADASHLAGNEPAPAGDPSASITTSTPSTENLFEPEPPSDKEDPNFASSPVADKPDTPAPTTDPSLASAKPADPLPDAPATGGAPSPDTATSTPDSSPDPVPDSSSAKAIPPPDPVSASINLLPVLSVNRDELPLRPGEPSPRLWKEIKGNAVTFSDPKKTARLAAPVSLAGIEDCEIEFVWKGKTNGEDSCMILEVPIAADQWVPVKIAIAGDKVDIGWRRQGYTGSHRHNADGMRVAVRRVGNTTIVVTVDGKEVAKWQGPWDDLTQADLAPHALFAGAQLPVLTGVKGTYTILEWKVRAFGGDLAVLDDPRIADDARLVQLEKGYQNAFDRDANRAFLNGIKQLDKGFAGAVERSRKEAQQRGALDDVVELRKELKRITDGDELAPGDPAGTSEVLVALRATYRTARAKLVNDRNTATIPLYDKYLGALTAYEAELTRGDKIARALAIRDYRKPIVARRSELIETSSPVTSVAPDSVTSTDPLPPRPTPQDSTARPASAESRKELAEWLLTLDARFVTVKDGEKLEISKENAEDLPSGNFTFASIHIDRAPQTATNDDFSRLSAAREVVLLGIGESPVSSLPALRLLENLEIVILARCPKLDVEATLKDLGSLPALRNVEFLYGSGPTLHLPAPALASLSASRSLEYLRFENVGLDDTGFAKVAAISTLRHLNLDGGGGTENQVNGSALTAFAGHPSLTELNLYQMNAAIFDASHLAALAPSKKLTTLSMDRSPLKLEGFVALGKVKSLKHLRIEAGPTANDEALAALASLPNLEDLAIRNLRADGMGFANFQSGSVLATLALEGDPSITDSGLATVAETFPELQNLIVEGTKFGNAGIQSISTLKSLVGLTMRFSPSLEGDTIKPLSEMSSLTRLHLFGVPLDANDLLHISEFRNLLELELAEATIDIEGFTTLSKLRKLQRLDLRNLPGGFHDEWIPTIQKMRGLQSLLLQGNGFEAKDDQGRLQDIRDALPDVRVDR